MDRLSDLTDDALGAMLSEAIEDRERARERVRGISAELARRQADAVTAHDPDSQVVRVGGRHGV